MEVIIYTRWSSFEQASGTSAERQMAMCEAFAKREGWPVVERVTDDGASAWTGANIESGNLAKLIERLSRDGGAGKVLVVERLDRLSRRPALEMLGWVQKACATGLTISTADSRHRIDATALQRDNITIVGLLFEAFRGFDESQAKSERVAEAWRKKRERGAAMTARCPAWLRPVGSTSIHHDQTDSRYEEIPERANIIRWIFAQSVAGVGTATIARRLNENATPVFGRGAGWHSSYIKKILASRAVIGEFTPGKRARGAKARQLVGEPIPDYFPRTVDLETFAKVNAPAETEIRRQQSGHNRLVNLLAGLATCMRCKSSMVYISKGGQKLASGGQSHWRYLKCSSVHRSHGNCQNRHVWNYNKVEAAILDAILTVAMDDQHFESADTAREHEIECARLGDALAETKRAKVRVMALVEADSTDSLVVDRYAVLREQEKGLMSALEAAQAALAEARGSVSSSEHIKRVNAVRADIEAEDEAIRYEARRRIKLALNALVAGVYFVRDGSFYVVLKTKRVLGFDKNGVKGTDFERRIQPESVVEAEYLRRILSNENEAASYVERVDKFQWVMAEK